METLIPYLKSKGVGIINASLLSMGLLTEQVSASAHLDFSCAGQSFFVIVASKFDTDRPRLAVVSLLHSERELE